MHVLALSIDLHLPDCRSLKAKRGVIRPIVDGARQRYRVASAEVDHQDRWQRSRLGFVAVSGSARQVEEVIDDVERFVWSFPSVEVLTSERTWLETERNG
jgi:uncharacterized protein YlxP (DUF503 family)